ncbi:MAG: helix-turn-helix domain-containing protein [Oligoflexus sp.]
MMTSENTSDNALDPTFDTSAVAFPPGTKLREIERIVILETLKQKNFNRTHTARALGIGIRTLQRKLKRYGASDWGLKASKVPSNSGLESSQMSTPVAPEAPSLNN